MTDVRDLIANLTLAVIDLAGAVAQIAETMPEHTQAQINDSLNVAVTKLEQVAIAISAGDAEGGSAEEVTAVAGVEAVVAAEGEAQSA
ncbi:hypothetical protein SAMN04515617_11041 [Collimonas sp. OK242]|jgi:hypothetical protein|uniref:hypothetical protein n=1 Tax=Collimonas sp. OK242 TaxID=1798195 RepID=UPI00089C9709|nr:hypothetical protein [Collimonas sp. OK242]SDY11448.1 hypothetical protein SAMN04515617_11041 [Collimonas sp. OK242]